MRMIFSGLVFNSTLRRTGRGSCNAKSNEWSEGEKNTVQFHFTVHACFGGRMDPPSITSKKTLNVLVIMDLVFSGNNFHRHQTFHFFCFFFQPTIKILIRLFEQE